jgi:tryptophan synthase alpha chain
MRRIGRKFKELKGKNEKALITFITAGDRSLEWTKELIYEMDKKGADIIEIGIPYSDPIAEGPTIQAGNIRARKNKLKIKDIMNLVKEVRKKVDKPILYLLYFNCVLKYGIERFLSECKESGVDGLIMPDLPYEESWEINDIAESFDIDIITLVSPTSKERISTIAKNAKGFLYCVSSLGVTGEKKDFDTDFDEFFKFVNKASSIPTAIGFGISGPEHIKKLKEYADGLIVGSAIIRRVGESKTIEEAKKEVGSFTKTLKKAME